MTPNQKEAYDHMQKALEKLLPMARKHGTLFGSINPWTEACDIGDTALTVVKNVQNEQLRCGVLGALYTADQMRAYGQASREDLIALVQAVHKAKGRYHSQIAMCNLYDACGLPNTRPTK